MSQDIVIHLGQCNKTRIIFTLGLGEVWSSQLDNFKKCTFSNNETTFV